MSESCNKAKMAKLPCNAHPEDASAEGAAIISAQAPYAIASASPFFRLFPLLALMCQSIQRYGSQNDAVNSANTRFFAPFSRASRNAVTMTAIRKSDNEQ